jgi:hypothetical protein
MNEKTDTMLGETHSAAYFCPECGSASLDMPMLSGGPVTCRGCSWVGDMKLLLTVPISHTLGSQEEIAYRLMSELRLTLAKFCALPLGKFLLEWGFVDAVDSAQGKVINPRQLGRYMTVICGAILKSVIEEREKISKERVRGS